MGWLNAVDVGVNGGVRSASAPAHKFGGHPHLVEPPGDPSGVEGASVGGEQHSSGGGVTVIVQRRVAEMITGQNEALRIGVPRRQRPIAHHALTGVFAPTAIGMGHHRGVGHLVGVDVEGRDQFIAVVEPSLGTHHHRPVEHDGH